jgi:hypothetical protein
MRTQSYRRVHVALGFGAVIWLALVLVGFLAPGGWQWGMAGPVGHIENYMISLWIVTLVLAPLLAIRDVSRGDGMIRVYLLGILAIVLSTFRAEDLRLISDAPPLAAAVLTAAAVLLTHPNRASLLRF